MVALATRIKRKGYLLSLSTLMTCLFSLDRPAFVDRIGPLHDPVTWYGINYTGTQITQWAFQNKET